MKIKLAELRRIISEVAPDSAEFASLPQEVRITSVAPDKTKTVHAGDRDMIYDILSGFSVPDHHILALMKGQKFINTSVANALAAKGAFGAPEEAESDMVNIPGMGGGRPAAPAAPRAAGGLEGGRMSPERAKEYVMYYMRRFAKAMVQTSPDLDAASAAEVAPNFLDAMNKWDPRGSRFVARSGLSNEEVNGLVVDTILDMTQRSGERAARTAAAAASPGRNKETYKIYPGGKRWASPVVTRVKGKVFVGPRDSKFKPGEQAAVAADGDRLRVKKTDSDHAQMWDPE